jgi:GNAT superfamily N-acetyltransferase
MPDLSFRALERPELDLALDWAAKEGWNPGRADAESFWAADPDGFLAVERNGQLVGVSAIVSYDARFGFIGMLIVRPDVRRQGIGTALWAESLQTLRSRLLPGSTNLGLEAPVARRAFLEKQGFQFHTRHVRFEGRGVKAAAPASGIAPAARVPFANILALDSECFPAPRPRFLNPWLRLPGSAAFAATPRGTMGKPSGYAVVRPARNGFRIGPLFAKDDASADALFTACSAHAAGQPLFIDVPEINAPAMALAAKHGMKEIFSMARMYLGAPPASNPAAVYGVTTSELG